MDADDLRAYIERSFDLAQLCDLCAALGFDSGDLAPDGAAGALAAGLVRHAVGDGAVEALCDAMSAELEQLAPDVAAVRNRGFAITEPAALGSTIGPFELVEQIGSGSLSTVFTARHGDEMVRLKLLRREIPPCGPGTQRFLTATRMAATVEHEVLPGLVRVGRDGDRVYVAARYVHGRPMQQWCVARGAIRLRDAWAVLRQILEGLAALHDRRLVHGNVHPSNVIVYDDGDVERTVVVDAGGSYLRAALPVTPFIGLHPHPDSVAPELIRGEVPTPRSDVYAFGALLYRVIAGRAPFRASTAADTFVARLSGDPDPVSFAAPRGTIPPDVDEFVVQLLDADPERRPATASEVLDELETLVRLSVRGEGRFPDDEFDARVAAVLEDPADAVAAAVLEAGVDQGADPVRAAEAFRLAADQLDGCDGALAIRKQLLTRAAALFERSSLNLGAAEQTYELLTRLDPDDESARASLERIYRYVGDHDRLVEMLLSRAEKATDAVERATLLARLGSVLAEDMGDRSQALIAFVQAFATNPHEPRYADEIERLADGDESAWKEVFATCSEAVQGEASVERKNRLLARLGRWYSTRASRPELALKCYQAILLADPGDDAALQETIAIYRNAKQWRELVDALILRANGAVTPATARDLVAEAGDVLREKLGDIERARDSYEQVLAADPAHERAAEGLAALCEEDGDLVGWVRVLERRSALLDGEARRELLLRIAETEDVRLGDRELAISRYRTIVREDPSNVDALLGLERAYAGERRFADLVAVLEREIAIAVTPRQKVSLWERLAEIHGDEFLDHERAARAREEVLKLDPTRVGALAHLERHYAALERWEDLAAIHERQIERADTLQEKRDRLLALARVLSDKLGFTEDAIDAYERAREIDPGDPQALAALAHLRTRAGDDERALEAIEGLAVTTTDAATRAEQYVRAAKIVSKRRDFSGAIERYKLALEAIPVHRQALEGLRNAYLATNDASAAVQVLEREMNAAETDQTRAELHAQLAVVYRDYLHEPVKAEAAAALALERDPANLRALTVAGDVAFESGRFGDACRHYALVAKQKSAMTGEEASRVLGRYADALAATDATDKALSTADEVLALAPEDVDTFVRASDFHFRFGAPHRALSLSKELLSQFGPRLSTEQRAAASYRVGVSAGILNDLKLAEEALEDAAKIDPRSREPLQALADIYRKSQRWVDLGRILVRQLARAPTSDRPDLLVEMGDLAATTLRDPSTGAKHYLAALSEQPRNRKVLLKLLQLYSAEKDWTKLIDVILEMTDLVDDARQKAKYLQTAARVARDEVGDPERAAKLLQRAISFDPSFVEAIDEAIELNEQLGDSQAVESLLSQQVNAAAAAEDLGETLERLDKLGDHHLSRLRATEAIAAYEAAQQLEPDNAERNAILAQLYTSAPTRYFDKAVGAHEAALRADPYAPEAYQALGRIYSAARRHDAVWCVCQALSALQRATPEEDLYFKRHRRDHPLAAKTRVTSADWRGLLTHPIADPLVTEVFAIIQPAISSVRARRLDGDLDVLDPTTDGRAAVRALADAATILGVPLPPLLYDPDASTGIVLRRSEPPAFVLGPAGLTANLPRRKLAFVAAANVAYLQPGSYARYLVAARSALKAWLLAAMRLVAPHLAISADLEGVVTRAFEALEKTLGAAERDRLARPASRLLQQGATVDLAQWTRGVDFTSDRAGLLLADDLQTAVSTIRAASDESTAVPVAERVKEVLRFSVSARYIELRGRLGIDSSEAKATGAPVSRTAPPPKPRGRAGGARRDAPPKPKR